MLFDLAGYVTTSLVDGGVAQNWTDIHSTSSRAAAHLISKG